MKRIVRTAFVLLCLGALTGALFVSARAAAGDVIFSDPSAVVGDSVTVNVYATVNVAGLDMTLTYDTDLLTYTGFSGGLGNAAVRDSGGALHVVDYCASGDGRFSLNLSFTARAQGTAVIRPTACAASDAGGDELSLEFASHSARVSITSASANCDLSALYVEPGTLSPAFSPALTSYSVTVPNSAAWIAVSPVKSDGAASYVVRGNDSLAVGTNTVTVTVTAGNGAQKVYMLTVTRQAAQPAASATAPAPTEVPAAAAPAPTPEPTPEATPEPTPEPTPEATAAPTPEPTPAPAPTLSPEDAAEREDLRSRLELLQEENEELRWNVRVLMIAAAVMFLASGILGVLLVRSITEPRVRRRKRR